MFDSWEQWVVAALVVWAIPHSIMDWQMKKKVDEMEKQMEEHKH